MWINVINACLVLYFLKENVLLIVQPAHLKAPSLNCAPLVPTPAWFAMIQSLVLAVTLLIYFKTLPVFKSAHQDTTQALKPVFLALLPAKLVLILLPSALLVFLINYLIQSCTHANKFAL